MTRETVTQKLRKLFEKARSAEAIGNAAEAAAFSAKVQELLVKHELTMSDVEYAAVQEEDPIDQERFNPAENGIEAKRSRVQWQQDLAVVLADAFFCKLLVHPGSNSITFIGRSSHRQAVVYVYTRLIRDIVRLQEEGYSAAWETYRQTGEKAYEGFKTSFRRGFIMAVRDRLREEAQTRKQALAVDGNGVALLRLDDAGKQVDRWLKANVRTRKSSGLRGVSGSNRDGYYEGYRRGQNANLGADGLGAGDPVVKTRRLGPGR